MVLRHFFFPNNKIVMNLPRTYKKLHCKGEPYQGLARFYGTDRQTHTHPVIFYIIFGDILRYTLVFAAGKLEYNHRGAETLRRNYFQQAWHKQVGILFTFWGGWSGEGGGSCNGIVFSLWLVEYSPPPFPIFDRKKRGRFVWQPAAS